MAPSILAGKCRESLKRYLPAGLLAGAGALQASGQAFHASSHLSGSGSFFSFPDVSDFSSVRGVYSSVAHSGTFDTSGNSSNLEVAAVQGAATANFGDLHLFLSSPTKGGFASGGSGANAGKKRGGYLFRPHPLRQFQSAPRLGHSGAAGVERVCLHDGGHGRREFRKRVVAGGRDPVPGGRFRTDRPRGLFSKRPPKRHLPDVGHRRGLEL